MTSINPYLGFNGNCREAFSFYKKCLGGELTLQTVEDSPMAKDWPQEAQKHVLHAGLIKDNNILLLGSDMQDGRPKTEGNSVTLSLSCQSVEELEKCFSKLAEGATFIQPLHKFFAGTIGALTDKYGFRWMFHSDN